MKEIIGTSNRVLEIDLSTQKVEIYEVTETERKMYIGGKGLGIKLLYDRMPPGVDPLGPDNILAVMPGILMGTGAPCSGRFEALTKSPLTKILTTSSCGGVFGMELKTAGWDGLLIKGKAPEPTYLQITAQGVEFKKADKIWGATTISTQKQIASKKAGCLAIGPAGENLVKFASIAAGHRFLGRGGMGAVMGSKNLKAIVAYGKEYKIKIQDQKKFDKLKKKATAYIKRNEMSQANKNFGTNANVKPVNEAGILPIKNFSDGKHDCAFQISGEVIKEKNDTKFDTCKPCSILCGHKGSFGGKTLPVPEFETVGLLGANLGVFDREKIAEWNMICTELGIDTISAGGTIGWVMEAAEKGLVESDLRFGSREGVSEALSDIGNCKGFGKEMAGGVRELSEKYGGKEFAIHVKGLEMAAYDPRGSFGQGLSYAVANRGACHLSAYLIALEIYFNLLNPEATRAKPEFVKYFEDLTCGINSLQTCQFTMYAYTLEPPLSKYTPNPVLGILMQNVPDIALALMDISLYPKFWSAVTGIKMSSSEFLKAGERIHVLERYMNTREGISKKDDTLPPRILKEGRLWDPENKTVPLDKMLDKYYKVRGFDEYGVPTEKTLKKLGIVSAFERLEAKD